MSAPSELIKQHIGTIENQILKSMKLPEAVILKKKRCSFWDGVFMRDNITGFEYTPYKVKGNLTTLDSPDLLKRALDVYSKYVGYLACLDTSFIRHAYELQGKRKAYEIAALQETIDVGRTCWAIINGNVSQIEFTSVDRTRVQFKILNHGDPDKIHEDFIRKMVIYLTEKEAKERKGGYTLE